MYQKINIHEPARINIVLESSFLHRGLDGILFQLKGSFESLSSNPLLKVSEVVNELNCELP